MCDEALVMNSELERMWKSEVMIYIRVSKTNFLRGLMQFWKTCRKRDLRKESKNWDFPNRKLE
jgi:hypothetical protein